MHKKHFRLFFYTSLFSIFLWFIYDYTQTNFHTVLPNKAFRSAQLSAEVLAKKINEHQIATVVNLRGPNPEEDWYIEEKKVVETLKVKHIDIKLASRDLNRVNRIKKIIDIYQNQAQPILFHCKGGADRAGIASIVILLLEGKLSLDEIEKQVSWYYLVLKSDSTGKLFLDNYQHWLNSNKTKHTPDVFIYWVDNYYLDSNNNRLYRIRKINKTIFPKREELINTIRLTRADNKLIEISGTIMFYSGREKPTEVEILLNQKPVSKMLASTSRPFSKVGFAYYGYTQSEWSAIQDVNALKDGCYDVQLKLTRSITQNWISPPRARFCVS